jgi:phosphorylase superfamily protein
VTFGERVLPAVIGVTGLAFEARIAADRYTHAICSGNGRTLPESLASAIAGDCCGLISFGVAGGLSPDIPAGTCIVGSMIVSETVKLATDRDWSQALLQLIPDAVHGAIAGTETIVAHPKAKRSLRMSTGALAVDNESHVVASVAAARRLPMAAVRVIIDPAARQLPAAALAPLRANGTINPAALVHEHRETTWRTTDAASDRSGRMDRIRGPASLPSIAWLRPGVSFLEACWIGAGAERRGSVLRLPRAFVMRRAANPFLRCGRDRYSLCPTW